MQFIARLLGERTGLAIRSRDLEWISIALTIRSLDRSYGGNGYRSVISIRIFYGISYRSRYPVT